MMRAAAVLTLALALPACPPSDSSSGECEVDDDCGGLVCTRNAECLPASQIRAVSVSWTIRGQPPNPALCGSTPDFYLMFFGTQVGDSFGYTPVPCNAGLFVIDKLPRRFVSVEIGVEGRLAEEKAFDSQGQAAFDLNP